MSPKARILLMVVGAGLAGLVVWHSGPAALLAGVRSSGWIVPVLVVAWGFVYLGNAIAWRYLIAGTAPSLPLDRAFTITVSAFSLNYATPLASFGGEPVKAALAAGALGGPRATASVIAYRLLHTLSHLLVNLAVLVPAFALFPRTPLVWAGLAAIGAGMGLIVWFVVGRHRRGLLVDLAAVLGRLRGLGALARRLLPSRERLEELDHHLTDTYRERPDQFRAALGWEMFSRVLGMGEFTFILWAQSGEFRPVAGLVLGAFSSLVVNAMAFVPYELGTREAGLYALYHGIGLDPALGTQAALLTRIREVIWMSIGLVLLGATGGRPRVSDPGGES